MVKVLQNIRLEHTLTAEKLYSMKDAKKITKCGLILHCNEATNYLFVVNGTENIKFKANYSQIAAYPSCLGNISKDWLVYNIKKSWLKVSVYDFSVAYDAISVS